MQCLKYSTGCWHEEKGTDSVNVRKVKLVKVDKRVLSPLLSKPGLSQVHFPVTPLATDSSNILVKRLPLVINTDLGVRRTVLVKEFHLYRSSDFALPLRTECGPGAKP